jgi:CRISPR/Cas system CSM-associated protein Csm3 (group 7 of RAMP superfamily)
MAEEQFRLQVQLELQTDLHIAGPGRTLPLVDRSVEVDETGQPIIPASSFRGRTRAQVERLAVALGERICRAPRPDQTCPHFGLPDYCRICRIFGSAWRLSAVAFADLKLTSDLTGEQLSEALPLRTGVSLNRRLNTAEEARLFVTEMTAREIAAGKLGFNGEIEGRLEQSDLGLLIGGINTLTHLGGGKARGAGRVKIANLALDFYRQGKWAKQDWGEVVKEVAADDAN